jgi:type VI secretion system secreted protein VgrG
MSEFTQANRPFRLTVGELPADTLLCADWTCTESVSELWELRVEALSTRPQIAPGEVLLQPASLCCEFEGQPKRYFTGIVRRIERCAVDREARLHRYVLVIVPPVWQLDQRPVHAAWHDVDVQEVVDDVLGSFNLAQPQWDSFRSALPKLRGVTAWGETPWRFVTRLLEREGLWYAVRSTASTSDLWIGDGSMSAKVQHGLELLTDTDIGRGTARLRSAALGQAAPRAASAWTVTAHHAKFGEHLNEKVPLPAHQGAAVWDVAGLPFVNMDWEHRYDWHLGAEHDDVALDGAADAARLTTLDEQLKRQARLRAEAILGESPRLLAESTATGVASGAFVKLAVADDATLDDGYMVLTVHHSGGNGSYLGGDRSAPRYENRFEGVPANTPWSPPRRTPAPRVHGVVLATVVGPEGEEIHTDKYGRIRVQYDWDGRRLEHKTGPGDAWVGVAQPMAGAGWGGFYLPRVGQQVIVAFLEGDPDAPYCMGSLYNGTNLPLQKLPTEKTQSGIRTRSTPKGSAQTYNELRFEDKKGSEHVWFRAQSQFTGWVTNNVTFHIEDGTHTVTHKKGDRALTHDEGDDIHVMKKGSRSVVLEEGDDSTTLQKGEYAVFASDGGASLASKKALALESTDDAVSLVAKSDLDALAQQGNVSIKADAGAIAIQAAKKIELKVGANTVTIEAAGITLKTGPSEVKLAAQGVEVKGVTVKMAAQAMLELKANAMAKVEGAAMAILKGALSLIN